MIGTLNPRFDLLPTSFEKFNVVFLACSSHKLQARTLFPFLHGAENNSFGCGILIWNNNYDGDCQLCVTVTKQNKQTKKQTSREHLNDHQNDFSVKMIFLSMTQQQFRNDSSLANCTITISSLIYGNIYDKNKALKKGVLHKPFRAVRKTRGATMLFDYLGSKTTATQNQLFIMF